MQRICIVGLGDPGASLGLALRRWITTEAQTPDVQVTGFDYDQSVQKAAEKAGAVDRTHWSLARAAEGAALVVLAVPAGQLEEAMRDVAPLLGEGATLTDLAPGKQRGLAWAEAHVPPFASYVGGHPFAPQPDPDAPASADRYAGAKWGLFPDPRAAQASTELVVGLVQAVGARPYFADPAEFDAQVVAASLLPALAGSALMGAVSRGSNWRDLQGLAGGDLEAATRGAGIEPAELAGRLEQSRPEAVRWLDALIGSLRELRDAAAREDPEGMAVAGRLIAEAYAERDAWMRRPPDEEVRPERLNMGTQLGRLFLGRRRSGS